MTSRWLGVALVAGCLSVVGAARAQYAPPVCPPRMPEPIPCSPDMVPGPISPLAAPPGPSDELSLPDDGTGAYPCKECEPEQACYFHAGAQGWQRQHLGHNILAVQDPSAAQNGVARFGGPTLQSFEDLHQTMNFGPRLTLGYLWANQAIEFSGFYIFESNHTTSVASPGRIDTPFTNPPAGFAGTNGLFIHDNALSTTMSSTMWSAEANYRYTSAAVREAELLVGIRYLDLQEKIATTVNDDGTPPTNPALVATYAVESHNRLIGPQFGFEYDIPCTKWVNLGVDAKTVAAANFVELDRRLDRGDGLPGLATHHSSVIFSELYEINSFVDFKMLPRARMRLGYNVMWLTQIANVGDQYDFNLQNNAGFNRNGSIFYHGPSVELQFLF